MEGNSLKSFENLCKIFETRIKLDKEKNIETPPDVLINYEKYAKKIDALYNEDFEDEIKSLITKEVTIEKEEERLNKLIDLLKNRLTKREELENRFYLATGKYIKGLQLIVSESELQDKKDRLEAITKYLDTRNEINNVNESISKLKTSLVEEIHKQDEYIKENKIMEDELYSELKDILDKDSYFKDINEDNIESELNEVLEKVQENKETLDVTKDSVDSLIGTGTTDDYTSYVEDAERNYFEWKNRELILKIYELVINFEEEFTDILEKREKINKIIKKRNSIKDNLTIEINDELKSFTNSLEGQINILKEEKEVLDNVTNYTNRINFKEERLEELEEVNNSMEILSILREYGLIETYNNEEIETYEEPIEEFEENTDESIEEDIIVNEVIDPYRIVEVKDYPKTLNIGLAKLKGESVREKVNKKLNPPVKEPTFEDINKDIEEVVEPAEEVPEWTLPEKSPKTEPTIPTWEEPVVSEVKEESVPKWDMPSAEQENKNTEIPIWYEMSPFKEPQKPEPTIPTWKEPVSEEKEETIPKWDMPEIKQEEIAEMPKLEYPKIENNNSFWTPVDNSKLETNDFPSINIPISGNFTSEKDNFGFPDINN